jgi:hypothetical protein
MNDNLLFSPHISPVCLPDRFQDFSGRRCFVTGWGKDSFLGGSYQQVLKEVELPVVSNARCEGMLKRTKLGPNFQLHSGFLCAGGEEGKDACKVRQVSQNFTKKCNSKFDADL